MSNNPSTTLAPPTVNLSTSVPFCLAQHPKKPGYICTRLNDHGAHCCDEILGESWDARGNDTNCLSNHDHCQEKGLVRS